MRGLLLALGLVFSVCTWAMSPKMAAMQSTLGGWGDGGKATLLEEARAELGYGLRLEWQDHEGDPWPFWHFGWSAPAKGYSKLSFDFMLLERTEQGNLAIYLSEADGDRWLSPFSLAEAPVGEWRHYSYSEEDFSLWALGDGQKEWDTIGGVNLEPSGAGGKLVFEVANVKLAGVAGEKDLLDPDNLPRAYSEKPTRPVALNPVDPKGFAFVAGSMSGWTHLPNASIVEQLAALSPSVAYSGNGFTDPDLVAEYSERLAALGRPAMQENAVGIDFVVELTEAQAWGVRWDGESNNATPGKFDQMHAVCLNHPKVLECQQRRADACLAAGVTNLNLVDFVWPYWGGRWGYAPADLEAYRRALLEQDEGLMIVEGGQRLKATFWDYFEDYAGYRMQPADLGLASWEEYTPTTEEVAFGPARTDIGMRNLYLFTTLYHYCWLRFLNNLGGYLEERGGHLFIIPNPEDLANASDYVWAGRLANLKGNFPEYFGNPGWTEGLYRSGGYLASACHEAGNYVGPQLEINAGGHGRSYYDTEVAYAVTYDLCAAMQADHIKNDFLDEASWETLMDKSGAQHDRFRDNIAKVWAFDQFKADKPQRAASPLAVLTSRNANRYRGSLFYGFGATNYMWDGCLAEALAREGYLFDAMDTSRFAPVEEHQTLIWGFAEAPETSIGRIAAWLAADPSHTLVCHSYQPTRRISGTGYNPWNWKQDFIEYPGGGKAWGLSTIEKDESFLSGAVSQVSAPFEGVFQVGEQIDFPAGYYVCEGGAPLLSVDGRPLVSQFEGPGGSRVIYLHYRAGEPDTVELDRRIAGALAAWLGTGKVAESVDQALVHTYDLAEGSVYVVWNRHHLESWEFIYDGNREQRLKYKAEGAAATASVPAPKPGQYVVYELLSDTVQQVSADRSVELSLPGVTCGVFYVLPDGPEARDMVTNLREGAFRRLLTEEGQG